MKPLDRTGRLIKRLRTCGQLNRGRRDEVGG